MYKKLRIICTIISTLFLVVILPAATFAGLNGLTICGFGAGLFFFLTLIFKKAQYNWEEKHGIPHDIPTAPTESTTEIPTKESAKISSQNEGTDESTKENINSNPEKN